MAAGYAAGGTTGAMGAVEDGCRDFDPTHGGGRRGK